MREKSLELTRSLGPLLLQTAKYMTPPEQEANSPSVPRHVAAIMDGNGRWAKTRSLPRSAGHRAGAESVRACVEACQDLGVEFLTLYAFSSENWNRPQSEIDSLMVLLERFLKDKGKEMHKRNVRLRAIGRLDQLPDACRLQLEKSIEATQNNTGLTLCLALSYGGREEIVDATKTIALRVQAGDLSIDAISNETLSQHLYAPDIPNPDLLIRTSGEVRLSNFLLWQLSYTEIIISQKYWPDFRYDEFTDAVAQFQSRQRRFGRV